MTYTELVAEDRKVHGSKVNTAEDARHHLLAGRELHVITCTDRDDILHIAEFLQYETRNVGTLTHDVPAVHPGAIEDFATLDELVAACRTVAEWRCWHVYCLQE
jgi:hypothetical protein